MSSPDSPGAAAQALASQLAASFAEQIQRALGVELSHDPTCLAFADHHLQGLRDEDREPILTLVAASAGAWFGELLRAEMGATWIGDGKDPRKLRLLLEPAFLHFSPVDLAYEAIFGGELDPEDPRQPVGAPVDGSYQLDPRPNPRGPEVDDDASADEGVHPDDVDADDEAFARPPVAEYDPTSDQEWIADRLSELSPVEGDVYYSMTGRFETLLLILEMLAHRRVAEHKSPRVWTMADYVEALAQRAEA